VIWFVVVLAVIATLGAAAYGIHRLALYAERRGWIYYRTKGSGGTPWLGSLEGIYQPSMQHVVDEIVSEEIRADQDESGAGEPGSGS